MRRSIRKFAAFLKLAWSVSPRFFAVLAGSSLAGLLQTLVNVALPKRLVDELTGGKDISMLLLWGGLIVGANMLFALIGNIIKRSMAVQSSYVNDKMQQALGKKLMDVAFSHLENPYYLDLKERAAFVINNQSVIVSLTETSVGFVKNALTLAGLLRCSWRSVPCSSRFSLSPLRRCCS